MTRINFGGDYDPNSLLDGEPIFDADNEGPAPGGLVLILPEGTFEKRPFFLQGFNHIEVVAIAAAPRKTGETITFETYDYGPSGPGGASAQRVEGPLSELPASVEVHVGAVRDEDDASSVEKSWFRWLGEPSIYYGAISPNTNDNKQQLDGFRISVPEAAHTIGTEGSAAPGPAYTQPAYARASAGNRRGFDLTASPGGDYSAHDQARDAVSYPGYAYPGFPGHVPGQDPYNPQPYVTYGYDSIGDFRIPFWYRSSDGSIVYKYFNPLANRDGIDGAFGTRVMDGGIGGAGGTDDPDESTLQHAGPGGRGAYSVLNTSWSGPAGEPDGLVGGAGGGIRVPWLPEGESGVDNVYGSWADGCHSEGIVVIQLTHVANPRSPNSIKPPEAYHPPILYGF